MIVLIMVDSQPKEEEYSWSRGKEASSGPKTSATEPTKDLDQLTKEAKDDDADFASFLAHEEKESIKVSDSMCMARGS